MTKHTESVFQQEIIADMQKLGWLVDVPNGYIRHMALYAPDVIKYIRTSQPAQWDKVKRLQKTDEATADCILKAIVKEIDRVSHINTRNITERHGVLSVFRKGFKCLGQHSR